MSEFVERLNVLNRQADSKKASIAANMFGNYHSHHENMAKKVLILAAELMCLCTEIDALLAYERLRRKA